MKTHEEELAWIAPVHLAGFDKLSENGKLVPCQHCHPNANVVPECPTLMAMVIKHDISHTTNLLTIYPGKQLLPSRKCR